MSESVRDSVADEEVPDCNIVIWGQWKTMMDDPVLLNLDDLQS
jgi:hypothetical protein